MSTFTFMPIPMMAEIFPSGSVFISVSMPPNFLQEIIKSFGHFIVTFVPVVLLSAIVHPTAAVIVKRVTSLGPIAGLVIMLIYIFTPGGDTQVLPSLPFPFSWLSASTTIPSAAPFSASPAAIVFVEPTVL